MITESIRFRGRAVAGFLGAAAPPQSAVVAAVLAYRGAWDPYVLGMLRNMTTVADSFDMVAAHPPTGFTTDELKKLGAAYRNQAQTMLAAWNQFAGLTPNRIEEQSGIILKSWEDTITRISNLAADEKVDKFAPGMKWPDPPSPDVQRKVLTDLQSVAIDADFLGILGLVGSRGLQKIGNIATEALEGAAAAAGKAASNLIPWQLWVVVGVVVVGGVVAAVKLAPVAAAAYLPPRRPAA